MQTVLKKWSFTLRISFVNVTKSAKGATCQDRIIKCQVLQRICNTDSVMS